MAIRAVGFAEFLTPFQGVVGVFDRDVRQALEYVSQTGQHRLQRTGAACQRQRIAPVTRIPHRLFQLVEAGMKLVGISLSARPVSGLTGCLRRILSC